MTTRDTSSVVRIGLVLPDVMGTYGDDGNSLILRQRLRWRGYDAEIVRITMDDEVPESCDIYTLGGGEDSAQMLAARHLSRSPGLQRAIDRDVPVFAICAGLQVLGQWFMVSDGSKAEGLGVLDVTTSPQATRSIGEVCSTPQLPELTQELTGFENHLGATTLGPDARPLGIVSAGVGNGVPSGTTATAAIGEGVVQGPVICTYMHGPALSRNPELADLLLRRALGVDSLPDLPESSVPSQSTLRSERLVAARK